MITHLQDSRLAVLSMDPMKIMYPVEPGWLIWIRTKADLWVCLHSLQKRGFPSSAPSRCRIWAVNMHSSRNPITAVPLADPKWGMPMSNRMEKHSMSELQRMKAILAMLLFTELLDRANSSTSRWYLRVFPPISGAVEMELHPVCKAPLMRMFSPCPVSKALHQTLAMASRVWIAPPKRPETEEVVPEDCFFLLGDNARDSLDSRYWDNPFIHSKDVVAKLLFIGGKEYEH